MLSMTLILVAMIATVVAYAIGWRRGYAQGDHPRRRGTD